MKRVLVKIVLLPVLLAALSASASADLPLVEMRKTIDQGVDYLLSKQEDSGKWAYEASPDYDVGMTALCTLALSHTRLPRASAAVQKGLAWITQQPPEARTYSVGLIQMLLFENGGGSRHRRLVDVYAWMTVVSQQRAGDGEGQWGYNLLVPTPQTTPSTVPPLAAGYADHSNGQLGILALWYAQRSGYQVPKKVWQRAKVHYERTQLPDGGWTYAVTAGGASTVSMTPASTVSLYLCDEALAGYEKTHQCRMIPENPAVERGIAWVGEHKINWPAPYAWYAVERLGILTGRSEFGGYNWMEEGAGQLVKTDWTREGRDPKVDTAFVVLFLARALEPIIINKLKHKGDWNNDRYDAKKLTEYIGEKFQYPKQWRIVTLEASVDELLKVPILYVGGHEALEFTDAEKTKLREYVNRGGTLFGMACCGKKPFDESFRALVAELWPDDKLEPLAKTHYIFDNPRPLVTKPLLLGVELGAHNRRLGVIYSPYDLCCRWDRGGEAAKAVYDVGANIYFYVAKEGVKLGGVREGYAGHTAAEVETPR